MPVIPAHAGIALASIRKHSRSKASVRCRGRVTSLCVPTALVKGICGISFDMMDTTFFSSRETLVAAEHVGMPVWRDKIFAFMARNASAATDFFRIPGNRLVELGTKVEI